MKIYSLLDDFKIDEPLGLCLGFFDGLHLGHKYLIEEAKKYSSSVAALIFSDSASTYFHKGDQLITPFNMRMKYLKESGVDYVLYLPIDEVTSKLDKEEFVKMLEKIAISNIFVGEDFRFAYQAKGTVEDLKFYFNNKVHIIDMLNKNGEKISSRNIKQLLKDGKIKEASSLLGHDYQIKGRVIEGLHNGRRINFPTANLKLDGNYVIPRFGVYSAKITIDEKEYLAMVNVGIHPTISQLREPIFEVHIIDFIGDLYDKELLITIVDFIRDEMAFASLEDLKEQLNKDRQEIIKNLKKDLLK